MGFVALAALPASAQVQAQTRYTGVTPPAINADGGSGLGASAAGAPQAAQMPIQASQLRAEAVAAPAQARATGLAFTGADVAKLVMLAIPLIVAGMVINRRAQPRPQQDG